MQSRDADHALLSYSQLSSLKVQVSLRAEVCQLRVDELQVLMALIEDPILNSPFHEPARHFKFDEDGITNEILSGRRPSSHFVPIARAKKKGKQLQFDTGRNEEHRRHQ